MGTIQVFPMLDPTDKPTFLRAQLTGGVRGAALGRSRGDTTRCHCADPSSTGTPDLPFRSWRFFRRTTAPALRALAWKILLKRVVVVPGNRIALHARRCLAS